jgi:glycine/D-amino acid oxidase-like deaminating enzyme
MSAVPTSADVVIIGGSLIGSSIAYYLSEHADFDGTIAVIEPDPSYAKTSTTLSAASIREQFRHPVNIKASQYGMEFLADFHEHVQVDGESPDLGFQGTGYLFLTKPDGMDALRELHQLQLASGAEPEILDAQQLHQTFPWIVVDELGGASLGTTREGTMDAWALLQGFRARARRNGVDYLLDRAVDLTVTDGRVTEVTLDSGSTITCGSVINAAGTRAAAVAAMAGVALPVEARNRCVFMFDTRTPIDGRVPLTITPEGVWFRREQHQFLTGVSPKPDPAIDPDQFPVHPEEFEALIWPELATYIPAFEAVKVTSSWAGHYAYNTFDQNMLIGPATGVPNLLLANGFSGHGFQHAPAIGRGITELLIFGSYQTLDMSALSMERLERGRPDLETAII